MTKFKKVWQLLSQSGRLMVGVPNYEAYVAHMQAHHPELPILSEGAFVQQAMEARYGGKKNGKCPC